MTNAPTGLLEGAPAPQDQADTPADESVPSPAQLAEDEAREEQQRAADDAAAGTTLVPRHGLDLTLRADQVELNPKQWAALRAVLSFDPTESVDATANVQAFLHLSAKRGLDPWAREVYLIARGRGDKRKFTMQVGIDGYRKLAAQTGRYLGVVETLWTGQSDDDSSWWRDERGVMRRVWFDQWPASREHPGAACVIVAFRGDDGEVLYTTGTADWTMYAPYEDLYEGTYPNRRKVIIDGVQQQKLSDMWEKGGAHMLAKCAEALALRKGMPAALSGFVTHEEMHRLDAIENRRAEAERGRRILNAAATRVGQSMPVGAQRQIEADDAAQAAQEPAGPMVPIGVPDEPAEPVQQSAPPAERPVLHGDVVDDSPRDADHEQEPEREPDAPQDDAEQREHLLVEAVWMASLYPQVADADALFERQLNVAGVASVTDLPTDELRRGVIQRRRKVAETLRKTGHPGAAAYATLSDEVGPLSMLLGGADPKPAS